MKKTLRLLAFLLSTVALWSLGSCTDDSEIEGDIQTTCFDLAFKITSENGAYTFTPDFKEADRAAYQFLLTLKDAAGNVEDTVRIVNIQSDTPAADRVIVQDLGTDIYAGRTFELCMINLQANEACQLSGKNKVCQQFTQPNNVPCPDLDIDISEAARKYTFVANFEGKNQLSHTLSLQLLKEDGTVEGILQSINVRDTTASVRRSLNYDLSANTWKGRKFRICLQNTFASTACQSAGDANYCEEFSIPTDEEVLCKPLSFSTHVGEDGTYTFTATFAEKEKQAFGYEWILFEDLIHSTQPTTNSFVRSSTRVKTEEELIGSQDHQFIAKLDPGRAYRVMMRKTGTTDPVCAGVTAAQFIIGSQIVLPLPASCVPLALKVTEANGKYTVEPNFEAANSISYRFLGILTNQANTSTDTQWDYVVTPATLGAVSESFDLSGFPKGTVLRVCIRNQFPASNCASGNQDLICQDIVVK